MEIINNWRASHPYPLHVIYIQLRRMTNNNKSIIVAERLKRMNSIVDKLKRYPNMNLWRIQDLGGCRVIVETVDSVYRIAEQFESSRNIHILKKQDDYIQSPKASGYRSLHKVYEYKTDKQNSPYNKNMLIEIQFRTHLQHLWATAIETMGIFTKQSLKSGKGDTEVMRFFALISALFALEENTPPIPEAPDTKECILKEIQQIDREFNCLDKLSAISVAIKNKTNLTQKGFFIFILNYEIRQLSTVFFESKYSALATTKYEEIEQATYGK